MDQIRLSVSKRTVYGKPRFYHFLFRTDWMEYNDGVRLCETFLERFPSPKFKVTRVDRKTNQTTQDLN